MNLDNIQFCKLPFMHWEFENCTDDLTLKEISNCSIPDGERAYDGTRAADHTGQGKDGKLRLFITKNNAMHFPYLTRLINKMQSYKFQVKMSSILDKDLPNS